ncbi:hypothetical protein LMG22037_05050 [Paraburkholderia phenoliruptrix]|uniref:Signal recognition particle subunit FFH/SRP54 (Srp54) n=1 Tax=Paraburkholderia phenoliruptrix TaxID=252970 RepID=A0A6J5C254_9BURK|nr:hypothetical protein [Paraburkholderia phenoliruptrix]CAB3724443.1 hypothetical protein LMG22037_05050 [Paraburkholderia phenoliruptrix]
MKTRVALFVATAALLAASSVSANDAHHPDSAAQNTPSPAVATAGATQSAPTPEAARRFDDMHQQMQKMLAQMDKIRQTKDPVERKRLLDEHMQTMQDTMQAMHSMGGPTMMQMMGGQSMGGMSNRTESGKRGAGANQRMDMMEKRMDMMQLMMEQMIEQQKQSAPAQ